MALQVRKKSFLGTSGRNKSSKASRKRGSVAAGLTHGVDMATLASANAVSEPAVKPGGWRVVSPALLHLEAPHLGALSVEGVLLVV